MAFSTLSWIRDGTKTGFVATSGIWPLRGGGGWTKSVKCVTNSALHFHEQENTDTRYFIRNLGQKDREG